MKSVLSWSSGKDAAYTLLHLLQHNLKPDLLFTTVNRDFDRVSMHGLRQKLLKEQSLKVNIPLYTLPLSKDVSMKDYNRAMENALMELKSQEFDTFYFGDIFLEDLKKFREEQLKKVGFQARFPIWKKNTRELSREIIQAGIKAVVVTVNAKKLDKSFVGRLYNEDFLNDLPPGVDPCGENGEFHTFVFDAPYFSSPIQFRQGEKVFREYKPCSKEDRHTFSNADQDHQGWDTGFWYIDIIPDE